MWSACPSFFGGVTPRSDFCAGTVFVPQYSQVRLARSAVSALVFWENFPPGLYFLYAPATSALSATRTALMACPTPGAGLTRPIVLAALPEFQLLVLPLLPLRQGIYGLKASTTARDSRVEPLVLGCRPEAMAHLGALPP